MTSRDFCYWLQGLFELSNPPLLDGQQTDLVKRHLALVFKHEIDPSAGPPAVQAQLDAIHAGITNVKPAQIGGVGVGPHGEQIVYRC